MFVRDLCGVIRVGQSKAELLKLIRDVPRTRYRQIGIPEA
jgi:hypothetical protein